MDFVILRKNPVFLHERHGAAPGPSLPIYDGLPRLDPFPFPARSPIT